ncbi:hypothetical protein [Bradyrhizobium prioriisuperbiae]|uniref:hypothetical protein n=1 Tax=Bradyrhizobium prioriisuperbiae TaxID=2854389 RepID=UPI0028EE880A|nr:hypothetical protein [Bradyrhizobium prioritasuperba]
MARCWSHHTFTSTTTTASRSLRGASSEVQHFADHIIAERGVRYGRVVMIPTDVAKPRRVPANKRAHGHHHD